MAEITAALAAAHAPGLTGWFGKARPEQGERVRRAYDQMGRTIADARLDALIVVANDHLGNFRVTAYPDFVLSLAARHTGPDEWFRPWLDLDEYTVPGHPEVAGVLFEGLGRRGVRAFATRDPLRLDDNLSVPVSMLSLEELSIPVVPMLQNCTVPPVPNERDCYAVGQALGAAITDDLASDLRIGLLGSGGLSHEPGGPRYFEFDEHFDRRFLELLVKGDHEVLLSEMTYERMEDAGSGGTSELLSWIVVMGAIGECPCTNLGYEAVQEWRCGVGAVRWEV
jgi:aromatic ring-opening dioxygenase catalytic subunit (LigB family)